MTAGGVAWFVAHAPLAATAQDAHPDDTSVAAAQAPPPPQALDALALLSEATRSFAGFRTVDGPAMSVRLAETADTLDLLTYQPGSLGSEPDTAFIDPMPGEQLLAPARNLMEWSAGRGIQWAAYDTTIYQWASRSQPGTPGHAGINRFQLGATANLGDFFDWGKTIVVAQGRYSSAIGGMPPLASQIGSPYSVDADFSLTQLSLLRLFVTQQLGSDTLLLTVGKVNPNDYIFTNPYAGDETSQFIAAPLDGTDALPSGFNNYTLGAVLQWQPSAQTYINSALTSPGAGASTGTGVSEIGDGGYWLAVEGGYVFDLPGGGPSRWLAGASLTNTDMNFNVLDGNYASAWSILHAELHPDLGTFVQWSWSDPEVDSIQMELMGGLLWTDILGTKGGLTMGLGGGTSVMSGGGSQEIVELFFRTQVAPSVQFSIDFQYIPQTVDAPQQDDVFLFAIRQTLTF
ncbi:MAG: carbohydrate porin [Planctomycetota bacterium]|nr:carbohydrate porin [Planctomycetota bacterium]